MKTSVMVALAGAFFAVLAGVSTAQAQATRTWVSGVGDDVNPCSRTAPCKTFAGAISKTATGGEINCIDPGGFGAVTITKSITIDCEATTAGVLSSAASTIAITTGAVTLRGLDINGLGTATYGVNVSGAANVTIHKSRIFGIGTAGVRTTAERSSSPIRPSAMARSVS